MCLAAGALGGKGQCHSAVRQDFHSRAIHYLASCLPTQPATDRRLSGPSKKQSIFLETRMSEVLVRDLGLSGLEDLRPREEKRPFGKPKALEWPGGSLPVQPAPSFCLLLTRELLFSVRVLVMTPLSRREANSTALPWVCFLCPDPSPLHSLTVRDNVSLPSSFPGT